MGTILLMGAGLQTTVTGPTYDPDAQLFFNAESAAGVTLTTTQKNAVNQWVVDAKAAGIWTKMKAVYPLVGGTATSHKFNLKNPLDTNAAYRLVFNGGGTHSANGYQPGGVNGYASTFLIPNTVFGAGFASIGVYVNQAATFSGRPIGSTNMDIILGGGFVRGGNKASTSSTALLQSPNDGFIVNSRTSSTSFYFMNRNRAFQLATVTAVATYGTTDIVLGATNTNGTISSYSDGRIALAYCSDFLTQNESLLLYQITEKYQVALSRSVYPAQSFYYNAAYNNETNLFLFNTQITDNTIQTATDTLVSDLKTANIFTKMKALYPMVGGTATTHKYNLINPQDSDAAYRLAFVGGWTHSVNGAKANGINTYADTKFIASGTLSLYNSHLSFYSRTSAFQPSGSTLLGVASNSGTWNNREYWGLNTGSNTFIGIQHSSLSATEYATSPAQINKLGFMVQSRLSITATTLKVFKDGIPLANATTSTTGQALNTYSVYLSALHWLTNSPTFVGSYDDSECAFASMGDGLTDAEVLAYRTAVQTFNTTLSRQV